MSGYFSSSALLNATSLYTQLSQSFLATSALATTTPSLDCSTRKKPSEASRHPRLHVAIQAVSVSPLFISMDGGSSSSSSMNGRTSIKARKDDSSISQRRSSDAASQQLQHTMTEAQRSRSPSLFPHISHHPVYDPHYDNEHRIRRARLRLPPLDPRNRFPGDGFDFRRPVMAPVGADRIGDISAADSPMETIDLTREAEPEAPQPAPGSRAQRLPRYGRDIIDISSSEDEAEAQPVGTTPSQSAPTNRPSQTSQRLTRDSESPLFVQQDDDLEFLHSRPLSRLTSRNTSAMPGALDSRREDSDFIDLTESADADDDLLMVGARSISSVNRQQPIMSSGVGVRDANNIQPPMMERLSRYIAAHHNSLPDFGNLAYQSVADFSRIWTSRLDLVNANVSIARNRSHPDRPRNGHTHTTNTSNAQSRHGVGLPLSLNYTNPAFDLNPGSRQSPAVQQYEAPGLAAEGFTRNPGEDEEVVCPNCGKELAVGDEEVQRELWVIKQCGHVSLTSSCERMVADYLLGILWHLCTSSTGAEERWS